jgi:hypothetical protein
LQAKNDGKAGSYDRPDHSCYKKLLCDHFMIHTKDVPGEEVLLMSVSVAVPVGSGIVHGVLLFRQRSWVTHSGFPFNDLKQ